MKARFFLKDLQKAVYDNRTCTLLVGTDGSDTTAVAIVVTPEGDEYTFGDSHTHQDQVAFWFNSRSPMLDVLKLLRVPYEEQQ